MDRPPQRSTASRETINRTDHYYSIGTHTEMFSQETYSCERQLIPLPSCQRTALAEPQRDSCNLATDQESRHSCECRDSRSGRYGDDRDRTGNLRLAKPALSQLSYVPGSEARIDKSSNRIDESSGCTWIRTKDLSLIRAAL